MLIGYFPDTFSDKWVGTHFSASLLSGVTATVLTQPFDVMKTRLMSNRSEYRSVFHCALEIFKESPILGFFKGNILISFRINASKGCNSTLMYLIAFNFIRMQANSLDFSRLHGECKLLKKETRAFNYFSHEKIVCISKLYFFIFPFLGFVPSLVRLAPHTILMFVFKEQLTIHFGMPKGSS